MTSGERTCAGCNEVALREDLERFVVMNDVIVHDVRKKAPGRGIWVHPRRQCLQAAASGGFARRARAKITLPDEQDAWMASVAGAISTRVDEGMRVAIRSKNAYQGGREVEDAMKKGQVKLLILASDAGDASQKKYRSNAERKDITWLTLHDGYRLGQAAGKDFLAVLGIGGAWAARLQRDIQASINVFEG